MVYYIVWSKKKENEKTPACADLSACRTGRRQTGESEKTGMLKYLSVQKFCPFLME